MSLGERLHQVRKKTGLSQSDFAKSCRVGRSAQANFELDKQVPGGAYLIALATEYGVDIGWLLTGIEPALSEEERALLDNYRHCTPERREQLLAASAPAKPSAKKKSAHG